MICCLQKKCKQIALFSLIIFVILVFLLKFGILNSINKAVYTFFNEHENSKMYHIAIDFSDLFGSIGSLVIFSGMMIIFLKLHKIKEGLFSVIFAALSVGATILVKYTLLVPRPLHSINGLSGYSFPSGHAVSSIVIAIVFFLLISRIVKNNIILHVVTFFLIIYIFVSMLARVYIGSHWMSDILGSVLLVVFCYAISCLLFKVIISKVNL